MPLAVHVFTLKSPWPLNVAQYHGMSCQAYCAICAMPYFVILYSGHLLLRNATMYDWDWWCHLVGDRALLIQHCLFVSGKPKGLKNCTAVNQTFESLSIICLAGEALVSDQRFILEVSLVRLG